MVSTEFGAMKMKVVQCLLHIIFIIAATYAIIIAWKLDGFFAVMKRQSWKEQLSAMVDNAGPAITTGLVVLVLLHLLINKKIYRRYRAGNVLLFLLADASLVIFCTWLGMKL